MRHSLIPCSRKWSASPKVSDRITSVLFDVSRAGDPLDSGEQGVTVNTGDTHRLGGERKDT